MSTLVDIVARNAPGRFASLLYRAKGSGELARHTVIVGPRYYGPGGILLRSVAELVRLFGTKDKPHGDGLLATLAEKHGRTVEELRKAVTASRISLKGNDIAESQRVAKAEARKAAGLEPLPLTGYKKNHSPLILDGEPVKGATVNDVTGKALLLTLTVSKEVIEPGVHVDRKRSPRKIVESLTPYGRVRRFEVDLAETFRANGETWEALTFTGEREAPQAAR